jgi:L-threonylcarbamoyladenylate synthase
MRTHVLSSQNPHTLQRALEILQAGGLVAFPTDTVYGVGALAFDGPAVVSIYTAKDRPVEKAIPVLISDVDELAKVAREVSQIAMKLATHFWPGPLTLVVPKHPDLPEAVCNGPTVGVRIPDHPVVLALLRLVGPMAVTSANISGQPSPCTAQEVLAQLGGRIPLIIDGGKTRAGVSSTVVDCIGTEVQVLRAGPISKSEILSVAGQNT